MSTDLLIDTLEETDETHSKTNKPFGKPAKECTIEQLSIDLEKVIITGLVIAKYQPREVIFEQERQARTATVFTFTLMDSEVDFVNVSCWGSAEFITGLVNKFQVQSVG